MSIAGGVLSTTGNFEGDLSGQGVSAYSVKDGKLLWQTPVTDFVPKHGYQEAESWALPVVSDGKLYLRELNHLMCYQL